MDITWHGQSAFTLDDGEHTILIDPFDKAAFEAGGRRWDYPALDALAAPDLLLITHEHRDHNAAHVVNGEPATVRSLAGTHETPLGTVVGVASEHDDVAGTLRGNNVMYVFDFGGARIAHLGDLGQPALRPEQVKAIGSVDLLIVPVGGGPTLGGLPAAAVAAQLGAGVVVPMHYRTERIDFLEPVDAFAAASHHVVRLDGPTFTLDDAPTEDGPVVVVPAAP